MKIMNYLLWQMYTKIQALLFKIIIDMDNKAVIVLHSVINNYIKTSVQHRYY